MDKIRNNLSAKIFLGVAAILIVVCLLMFGILRIFMPRTYENELNSKLSANLQHFAGELESIPTDQWDDALLSFCLDNTVGATIFDENNKKIADYSVSVYTISGDTVTDQDDEDTFLKAMTFAVPFVNNGKSYTITVMLNANATKQIAEIFPKVFPYVLGIIFGISGVVSYFYSRFLAKPIVEISNVSKRMTNLDMTWRCDISRTDEIGVLANNLNEMAVRLDNALHDLQTANKKLKADFDKEREQDKRRRDFFSAISHELKTPVTILKGELDGMILNVGKFKDRDRYLQEAYETTQAIEKLVREIMVLAKLETISLNKQEISVVSLCDECIQVYNTIARNKHIEMSIKYKEDMSVCADREQLRTVLSNIIGNAVNYSPEGNNVDIRIEGNKFSVENSGVHISATELSRVWEPFYRTDKSRNRNTGGSGLGLYLVKSILDLHGFGYRIENTDNGVKFTISF